MIHISKQTEGSKTLRIHLEGTLDREHVVALNEVVREASEQNIQQLVLHCSGLLGADEYGLRLLSDLHHQGAKLLDLPVKISWKLHASESQTQRTA
jgi:anti-anti-sigma regulatory factor